jgi:CubicO group peptidase (beta-lactamase class C family)
MFTAVAILQLIDQGELSLDTKITSILGLENTMVPGEATVYHMLTMTSGMADWFDESGDWEEDWAELCREYPIYLFRRNEDYLPLFLNQAPIAPVGHHHQYNGAGYILLGLVIERLTGISYEDFIHNRIFKPAVMKRSGFPALDDVEEDVAEGYLSVESKEKQMTGWKKNIYSTTPAPAADGGATSTASDLVRFSQALRNATLLSPQMSREMQLPKVLQSEDRFRGYIWKYGFGITFLLDEDNEIVRWGLTGEEDGVSCRLYYYPDENLDVVILGNQSWCAGSLGWKIHDLIPKT